MTTAAQLADFRSLHEHACAAVVDAVGGRIDWEVAYDRVFSHAFMTRLGATGIDFRSHWCDPDTSYEGDVKAFVSALTDALHEAERRPVDPDPAMHAYLVRFTSTAPNAASSFLFKDQRQAGLVVITAESETRARAVFHDNVHPAHNQRIEIDVVTQLDGTAPTLHRETLRTLPN
jgi:hypothetical protein